MLVKRTLLALLMLACLPSAMAETGGYWTSNADWYYHLSEYCGGVETMVPISLDGAAAFDKYPCPMCVPGEAGEPRGVVESAAGLMVVRVPDSWLEERQRMRSSNDAWHQEESHEGSDAYRALGEYLSCEDLVRFLRDYREKGRAEALCIQPSRYVIESRNPCLSRRHIGGAWYYISRTEVDLKSKPGAKWWISADTSLYKLTMEEGLLICDNIGEESLENQEIELSLQDEEIVFDQSVGDLRIRVERVMDGYVALILCDAKEDAKRTPFCVEFCIGGGDGIWLFERIESKRYNMYACTLTEPELNALKDGATAELKSLPEWEPDYFGTPYSRLFNGDHYVIIDREGNVVREYDDHTIVHREASDRSFIIEQDSNYTRLDGWTLEPIEMEESIWRGE